MASLLRQIVAGPRARHGESGLDLCYVTDNIIATSGPSSVYPKKAYRNPTDQLVKYLDYKHDTEWSIWEFRAEGTGYPDSEVYGRIHHFPWPDHHPPPFALVPNIMASMRRWLKYEDEDGAKEKGHKKRVCVVHCKAGKGRSGSVAVSYLISQEGWKREDALKRFTERRMRAGFGEGVSIPSQVRWIGYVDLWTNHLNKTYVERPVEIVEIHVFGLRDGVKVAVEGYVEDGRRIQSCHIFTRHEKTIVGGTKKTGGSESSHRSLQDNPSEQVLSSPQVQSPSTSTTSLNSSLSSHLPGTFPPNSHPSASTTSPGTQDVLLRPSSPIIVPTSDVNIDFERRNKASYTGFTLVTSVAHVWFNAYFEGGKDGMTSGVFEIPWEALDGIKGSLKKGTKALDHVKVLWRYAKSPTEPVTERGDALPGKIITEPSAHEPVPEGRPTDWRGPQTGDERKETDPTGDSTQTPPSSSSSVSLDRPSATPSSTVAGAYVVASAQTLGRELGLRKERPESANISRASSIPDLKSTPPHPPEDEQEDHPYPDPDQDSDVSDHPDSHQQTTTTPAAADSQPPNPASLSDTSISASGFGKGPKSSEIAAVEREVAASEAGPASKPSPAKKDHHETNSQNNNGDSTGNDDGDGKPGPTNIIDVGLGRVGQIVERFKGRGAGGEDENTQAGVP